jgi:hypothetical protein
MRLPAGDRAAAAADRQGLGKASLTSAVLILLLLLLQVLSTVPALRRLMMGNTNITGRIPCRLFEEHEMKTVMFSVNKLEGDLPECVLGVSGHTWV